MEKTESSVKIFFTPNYGEFKFLKGNRDVDEAKVKRIVKEIENGVNILKYAPIICNEQMQILDGQHRYWAAKQTGQPVFFVTVPNMDLNEVIKINSNSSNWRTKDFLNSYCDLKKPAYQKIHELLKQYHGISPIIAACLLHSSKVNFNGIKEIFLAGQVEVKYLNETIDLLNTCGEFVDFIENPFSRRFIEAMSILHNNGKFDKGLMLQKLKQTGKKITALQTAKSIIGNMEEIFNSGQKIRRVIY